MTSGKVLALVYNLITLSDEVGADGKHVQRTTYPKAHFSGLISLKEKLHDSVVVTCTTETASPITMSLKEFFAADPKPTVLSEKFTDSEITLTEKEKAALKYVAEDRDNLPLVDDETIKGFSDFAGFDLVK